MKFKTRKHYDHTELKHCLLHPKKKAIMWTGHVRDQKTGKIIIAGWCKTKCYKTPGFYGWVKQK